MLVRSFNVSQSFNYTSYLFYKKFFKSEMNTGFIRGILRGVRYAKSLRVLFLHRRSPSWTTLVLYSRVVFIFNEPTRNLASTTVYHFCLAVPVTQREERLKEM